MSLQNIFTAVRTKALFSRAPMSLVILLVAVVTCVLLVAVMRLFFQHENFHVVTADKHDEIINDNTTSTSSGNDNLTHDGNLPQGPYDTTEISESIFVHIAGAVKNPGVYELEMGSRVDTAISLAGGLLEEAAPDSINLAAKVSDGQQVYVPTRDEIEQGAFHEIKDSPVSGSTQATATHDGCINVNLATSEELQTITGIGPSLATAIISDRESNGPFTRIEDLMRVKGIGEKKFASMRDFVCL